MGMVYINNDSTGDGNSRLNVFCALVEVLAEIGNIDVALGEGKREKKNIPFLTVDPEGERVLLAALGYIFL